VSGYTVKSIDEMAAIHHGLVKLAGAELGIENFGMQVLDIPPGFNDYPAHDHAEDGQEEVYVLLRGAADIEVAGERVQLEPGQMVRVSPECNRGLQPGPDGARILAIGCSSGGSYERPGDFQLEVQS
jgi:mannose-6-phosphate isomerase-like protein (cupin superfamily)